MRAISKNPGLVALAAVIATTTAGAVSAQPQGEVLTTVHGALPDRAEMTKGPEIEGIISARSGNRIEIATEGGAREIVAVDELTQVRASGGFLGLNRNQLAAASLVNGLPVKVDTLSWQGVLVADRVSVKNNDLKFANMIHSGTDQRFGEQAAATEALRGRMGDIDQYNVKHTINVNFDTGQAVLSEQAKADLCATAASAEGLDNALLLVVGYTDSTGTPEINQALSERRAGRVVNHLQQACGWKPYRMLTPTGMAEADPLAPNDNEMGKAQNRRVAVNVMVSKAVDGL